VSTLTVVVASHNRRAALLDTLPRHRAPVIFVDNASDDGTAQAVAARLPHVRVVRLAENLGAAARNVGARLAGTPYVAFADDDSYWSGNSLEHAAALLAAHPGVALLTGRVLVGPQRRLDPVSAYMRTAPLGTPAGLPGPAVLGFLACAAVVRREAFLAAGGFSPTLHVYGEEALLALDLAAAGWGLAYVPSLEVRHLPAREARDAAARRRREARNRLLTTWLRRPAPRAWRSAVAAALGGATDRAALWDAARELPWVLRNRRPVPPALDEALSVLEGSWLRFQKAQPATAP
jgi:N-acetylglucosaminyl-diphospho-decaprenol L-rhamnosyltransferase